MDHAWYSQTLRAVLAGERLSREQAHQAFAHIMEGEMAEAQVAGLLIALAARGESADEIAGAAMAMRDHVVRIDTGGAEVVDTCGTGGTGLPTFNISTCAAMVAAGAGVKMAKHGNRTSTRASGSADVLAALGVNIDADPATVTRCIAEAGVGFCFAVRCHPAMRHAAPVRKALGVRTLFNLLGPLTNPAGARSQLMGVFHDDLTELIAKVLAALGARRAMVVHAADGLDEISITAPTRISEVRDGLVTGTHSVEPETFGFERASLDALMVKDAAESAAVVRQVLSGTDGPARDIVLLNAAAALTVAGMAETIADGIPLARESIDTGRAMNALEKLIAVSNHLQK
jgi:anthranilate phosphoribosyltransferase